MENGELSVMTIGIQTMPMWSVDLLAFLALVKLSKGLDSALEMEPLSSMMWNVLETNRLSLSARMLVLESITVAMEKMQEFVV